MAKPKRESLRHQAAFEYYYSLGIVNPKERSLVNVSKRFGVSDVAVFGWSTAFKWQKRIAERENLVAELVKEKSIEDEVKMRSRHLVICKAIQVRFAELLKNKSVKPTPQDFVRVAQLEQLLHGNPTERSEVKVSAGLTGTIMAAILGVIETSVPDRCPHCSKELDIQNKISSKLVEASNKIGCTDVQ